MKLAFYEVFGDPERNGQITVTREGTAKLVIPGDTFLNHPERAMLRCKINDSTFQLVGKNGQATIYEGVVMPNTRRERLVQFSLIKATNHEQANGRIVLRSGDLNRGEAIYDIRRLPKNSDAAANAMVCFTPGTRILTAFGDLPIEDLRPGDLIHTADNGLQPLLWKGQREISAARLQITAHLRPVKISKDAFGPDLPVSDMWVSPSHSFLLKRKQPNTFNETEVLIPASGLINGASVAVSTQNSDTTYIHLLFEEHQVVFSENVPTESFFACPNTLMALTPAARQQVYSAIPELQTHPMSYSQPARLTIATDSAHLINAA